MLHYPTLPFIAMHFTCNMQCTSDFPTLQCIAPHFQSTGFRFVVQCVTSDAMQCVISAWRSKYIPIPQPGQCSAARLKSVPGFTASKLPSSPTHRLIYLYAGTFFGFRQIWPQTKAFLCLPRNKVIVSSLRWLFKWLCWVTLCRVSHPQWARH